MVDTDNNSNVLSLESLQALASQNGPGYLSVLHPVCGCPEVTIFVPCYCLEHERRLHNNEMLSLKTVKKLISTGGKHIVLPRNCRIEKPNLKLQNRE